MGDFVLPSGRRIETVEPSYGDEVHVISIGLKDAEAFTFAKFAAIVPGLTEEDARALSRRDGRALAAEVNRIWNGRPEEKDIPFGKRSRSRSMAATPRTEKRSAGSLNTGGVGA